MANEQWLIVAKAFEAARAESGSTEYTNYSWRENIGTKASGGISKITQESVPVSDVVVSTGITSPSRQYTPYIFRAGQAGVKALIHFEESYNAEPDTR